MTHEAAITRLKFWQKSNDTEVAHSEADEILCELLSGLGYKDIVREYKKIPKWYA